jgi:ParB-like chromosome segregation protein Spo0J
VETTAPEHLDYLPVVEVEIAALSTVDSPRIGGKDPEHVALLAAASTELPPILVHRRTMQVIDGAHRLKVAELRGQSTIAARFFDGDEADAFVLAVSSNTTHGLPLTPSDRKHAAGRIITTHPHWSDRMIASIAGIAPGTVAGIRKVLVGPGQGLRRIGQDGRVRPIDSSIGRRRAGELLLKHPNSSLREIAGVAGISPETVRDVRNRLHRGEAPPPARREKERAEVDGPAVIAKLRQDPSLRFSETGRNLLRLLDLHLLSPQEWTQIIDNVPPHCSTVLADLGRQCAKAWAEFAVRMDREETAYDRAANRPSSSVRASR